MRFSKGVRWVTLRGNVWLNVMFAANISAPLDTPNVIFNNITAERLNTKMYSRLNYENLYAKNCEMAFWATHWGN